ncbi:hypothetical protein ROHU_024667 [Labeo rohita]|uniref:Uncharacterized protein n=1 Tax=Labeo rohita TaxID=84645 RepID=A0A498MMQ8_LABRO|nr:hypothetical protein ROHU_024667 [Labeo rohita]
MAELPKERVETSVPFLYVGMDCFGPFSVKRLWKEYKSTVLLIRVSEESCTAFEVVRDIEWVGVEHVVTFPGDPKNPKSSEIFIFRLETARYYHT